MLGSLVWRKLQYQRRGQLYRVCITLLCQRLALWLQLLYIEQIDSGDAMQDYRQTLCNLALFTAQLHLSLLSTFNKRYLSTSMPFNHRPRLKILV